MIRLGIDRSRHCAMVQYDSTDSAKDALNSLKGSFIGNSKRLMVCYYNITLKGCEIRSQLATVMMNPHGDLILSEL